MRLLSGAASLSVRSGGLTAPDQSDDLVPDGLRQPDSIGVHANPDALVGDLRLGAFSVQLGQSVTSTGPMGPPCCGGEPTLESVATTEASLLKSQSDISIGELSRRTECNVETIRYYERIGLLPKPRRQGGRFRRYDADDLARLRFVRRARQLGFTLDVVRSLLGLAAARDGTVCAEARRLAAAHVADLRAKIADLQAMERVLSEAICECEAGWRRTCPLIEVLSEWETRQS